MKMVSGIIAGFTFVPAVVIGNPPSSLQRESSTALVDFATCIADMEPEGVRPLIGPARAVTDAAEFIRLLHEHEDGCALSGDLAIDANLLRGALANAIFVRDNHEKELPGYVALPAHVTNAGLQDSRSSKEKDELLLVAFAECVFKNKPEAVRRLLMSAPMGSVEAANWTVWNDVMSACLPTEGGVRLEISRIKLRSLFGGAAFMMDSALVPSRKADEALN